MGLIYNGAPGCSFKPTNRKSSFIQHLATKTWCQCKDVNWTAENAVQGQQDGRTKARTQTVAAHGLQTINVQSGDHSPVNVHAPVNVFVLNVPPSVLPSGSEEERAFLLAHADTIMKSIVSGIEGPNADILSRFVRETWCSPTLPELNNVMALKGNNLEFIRLYSQQGQNKIETLVGKEAPLQLVKLALNGMVQLAKDSCGGYNPAWPMPACYDQAYERKEEAEAEHAKYGAGSVYRRKHDSKWINDRSPNAPPAEDPALLAEADQAALVANTLRTRSKEKKRVARVISSQLQQIPDKRSQRRKLMAAAQAEGVLKTGEVPLRNVVG